MTDPETTTPVHRSFPESRPFDRLITLFGGGTRRRVLQGLLSAALVALSSTRQDAPATAKRCKGVGKRCGTDNQCCSAFCDRLTHQCVATCGTLSRCAPGCSCYRRAFAAEQVCLRDPADPPACASLQICLDSDHECP